MKKEKLKLCDFEYARLQACEEKALKGGHTRVRRPGRTTIVTIWDDVDVRLDGNLQPNVDLVPRFRRRGG